MLLELEKNIYHICNDKEVIAWAVENLDTSLFHFSPGGFGCSCGSDEVLAYAIDLEDNPVSDKFLLDRDIEQMKIYFCEQCHEWAVDDDF